MSNSGSPSSLYDTLESTFQVTTAPRDRESPLFRSLSMTQHPAFTKEKSYYFFFFKKNVTISWTHFASKGWVEKELLKSAFSNK